jgi:DNA-binding MarR family transcriptional regulator
MSKKASDSKNTAETRLLADRLHSAAIHLLRRLRRVDEATGLSGPKLSALSVIVFGGPVTLGELAAAEQVRPPTLTPIIRELEAGGLIRREIDKEDRRVARVRATAAGKRLVMQGRNRRVVLLAAWLKGLSAAEYAAVAEAAAVMERFPRAG